MIAVLGRTMLFVLIVILLFIALSSISTELIMRIRLSLRAPSGDKLVWWRRGGDEMYTAYAEAFPRSWLPLFVRVVFWLFIASAVAVLLNVILRSR